MVESQTGKGSEFYFRLCLPTGKDSTNYRSENALELRQFHDIRILVAEDNDLNAEIVKELLEMEGASAERAVNGQEAVERFLSGEQGRYQLILMDIKMPLKNGGGRDQEKQPSGCRNSTDHCDDSKLFQRRYGCSVCLRNERFCAKADRHWISQSGDGREPEKGIKKCRIPEDKTGIRHFLLI